MKIIDLLNKIENGEIIPQKIKVDGTVYKLDILEYFYKNGNGDDLLQLATEYNTPNLLNMEVELIEDETIDIDKIEEMTLDGVEDVTYFVNDLIKAVKQLNKKVNELESLNIEINEKDINEAISKAREQRNKEIKSIKEK